MGRLSPEEVETFFECRRTNLKYVHRLQGYPHMSSTVRLIETGNALKRRIRSGSHRQCAVRHYNPQDDTLDEDK